MPKQNPSVLKISNFKNEAHHKSDVYIRTFQQHKAEHPFVMEAHAHDFYLIMLFTKGSGTHTIDFNTYNVSKGSLFFMSPSEIHSWNLSEDADGFVLFFNASFYVMDALSKQLFLLPFFKTKEKTRQLLLNEQELKKIKPVFKSILEEAQSALVFRHSILRAYLDVLLFKLADLRKTSGNERIQAVSLVPELQALIESNFMLHWSVSLYAEKLNTTSQQLNTITKNYLNKTVAELIQERMMAEAKRLLVYTSLTISEIAYQLNFNDNSYFNRFFKKAENNTPEQFRKRFH
jgi:AraC-like DNA-binding protein